MVHTARFPSDDNLVCSGHALKLMDCDHAKGLGIFVPPIKEQRRVFTHGNGTAFCLNEEENEAAVDLHVKLAKAFHDGKRKVKALQDEAMATGGPGANAAAEKAVESYRSTLKEQIIRDEIERCAILGEHDTDESTLPRQVKYVSTVLTNFNTRDECNKKLEEIAILYVKIRLGYVPDRANPCEGDELQAMILAVNAHYRKNSNGLKNVQDHQKSWALFLAHMTNFHIRCKTKLPPLAFDLYHVTDTKEAEPIR